MLEIVLIVLGVLALAVIALVATGVLRALAMRRRHRARLAAAGAALTGPASLFGRASERRDQRPGPGTLGLGPDMLIFVQLVPERELQIPREAITSVSSDRHFMGRTAARELLVVTWDDNGMGDAAAFAVDDVAGWRERLS